MCNTNYTRQMLEKGAHSPQLCSNHLCDLEQSRDVPCYQYSCLQESRIALTDFPLMCLKF